MLTLLFPYTFQNWKTLASYRINKHGSQKDQEQKKSGNYFFYDAGEEEGDDDDDFDDI